MECEKEIIVSSTTTITNHPPVQFELPPIKVEGLFNCCASLKGDGPIFVPILPKMIRSPEVVLIKPDFPDPKKVKFTGGEKGIRYYTSKNLDEAKPLKAPHLFYGGMTEWITDPLQWNALRKLYFWSDYKPGDPLTDEEKKKGITLLECVKVHILVGYFLASCQEEDDENEDEVGVAKRERKATGEVEMGEND